jgi:hypothetical protein
MVEYALLLGSSSLQSFASDFALWASGIDWHKLSYALFGLVALRIAFWAFRPSNS